MKWLTATRAMAVLVALVLIMGAANLVATRLYVDGYKATQARQQAQQRKQGEHVLQLLCSTFGELAANKPPAGNPKTNPSRGYDQRNHAILDQVSPDIGCR